MIKPASGIRLSPTISRELHDLCHAAARLQGKKLKDWLPEILEKAAREQIGKKG